MLVYMLFGSFTKRRLSVVTPHPSTTLRLAAFPKYLSLQFLSALACPTILLSRSIVWDRSSRQSFL